MKTQETKTTDAAVNMMLSQVYRPASYEDCEKTYKEELAKLDPETRGRVDSAVSRLWQNIGSKADD